MIVSVKNTSSDISQNQHWFLKSHTVTYTFYRLQIIAVILCDTGIALLAYMDGITGSPTLGGVVLAASAAAGSAVYKVCMNKAIWGDGI